MRTSDACVPAANSCSPANTDGKIGDTRLTVSFCPQSEQTPLMAAIRASQHENRSIGGTQSRYGPYRRPRSRIIPNSNRLRPKHPKLSDIARAKTFSHDHDPKPPSMHSLQRRKSPRRVQLNQPPANPGRFALTWYANKNMRLTAQPRFQIAF